MSMEHTCSVVSFGGGVNSTAMLVGLEERGEPPDHILFADTGGEKPETYDHLERMQSWLRSKGFPKITTVREGNGLEDDCIARDTLPGKAFGFGSCSERFKIRPQRRWAKQLGHENVVWLVGIHFGERKRAERTLNQRNDVSFPLIDWRWDQEDCVEAIRCGGIPVPVKSACFFCPAMKKREVIQLSKDNPSLFARAVEMEDAALESGKITTVKGLGRSWSWRSLVAADASQLKLFDDTQSPICDTCIDW
ncbi:phosphoadenosine phosphosulfate reductase domain-containing protein [Allorhodopirellula heiligendammensis]|uniref:Phosphoadenosine phosphosulfate reductase family protein n=1 Tax=Allorhodopirellula heiligendammensis TaxID=2714739 RepID=A0A5C6C6V0_9BACT|nr:phosphoadenosine phosphosulfate reductase family protein [Allorhodopirellula heiligendammensis]TWU19858.1 Phosphoadenosine phosphosulfate reductase family protein [Allorhodopirellula heiligendammensis]